MQTTGIILSSSFIAINLSTALTILGISFIVIIATAAIGIRMDRKRIRVYIKSQSGKVLRIRWTVFGPGWFGDRTV